MDQPSKVLLVFMLMTAPVCLCSRAFLNAFKLCVRLVRRATLKDYDLAGFHGSRREKKASPNSWRNRLSSPKSVNLNGETVKLATQKGNIRGWFLETSNTQNSAAVVLYLHGVSATRAYPPRVDTYRAILAANFPVLAIDYRGFGDSDDIEASETTMVEDSMTALRYLQQGNFSQVIIWGHSLGAAVAVGLASKAEQDKQDKDLLLVLES